jgi:Ca-activated chloride channel homolog
MRYLLAFLVTFSSSLYAQQQLSPQLVAFMDSGVKPIQLSKLDVDVRIQGEIAETRTTMTFGNPSARVLEGEFTFPLPEEVTLSGYALDVNGVLVDGVVAEKDRARQVLGLCP